MKKLLFMFLAMFSVSSLFAAENGENMFHKTWETTTGVSDHALWQVEYAGDMDQDGKPEFVSIADEFGVTVNVFESTGNDQYALVWSDTLGSANVIYSYTVDAGGDLDRDGLPEIVVGANAGSGQDAIWIYEWDGVTGSDNYVYQTSYSPLDGGGAGITALHVADLDGDGVDEMFIGETAYDDFYVVQLDTNTSFTSFPNWIKESIDGNPVDSLNNASDYSPWGFTMGDFDGDGKMNFATVEWDYNGVIVFEATGPNTYTRELWLNDMTYPNDGTALRSLASADLDGDGYMELLIPSSNGRLYVLKNSGDMSAVDPANDLYTVFADTSNTFSGAGFGDQDMFYGGIGEPDLYIAADDSIWDVEYTGGDPGLSSSWSPSVIASNADEAYQDIAVGDWDGDGQKEFAAIATDGQSVQVFEHDGLPGQNDWNYASAMDSSGSIFQIRGIAAGSDLDQDGKPEVFVTDYRHTGMVHVFEVTGDNTLEWVFDTDSTGSTGDASAVRNVVTGDLDNDGNGEFMFTVNGSAPGDNDYAGLVDYEWDGSTDNGYVKAAHITIDDSIMSTPDRWSLGEQFAVADLDGDGQQEVMLANNGAAGNLDRCYILSIDGTFESGFYTVVTEGMWNKTDDNFGGSPYGVYYGDTDGDGNMEAIFNIWDHGSVFDVEATGPDTYEYQNYLSLDYTGDGVFLDGITVTDIDGDGKDEIYAPIYSGAELAVVNSGDDISAATVENNVGYVRRTYGGNWGGISAADYDGDGTPELYGAQYFNYVYQYMFDGTDVMDPAAYTINAVETDSMGISNGSFAIATPGDLDGDGHAEVYIGHLEIFDGQNYLTVLESTTGGTFVKEDWNIITPSDYKLSQNYPNPFNPTTQIRFSLPLQKEVSLVVYDLLGHQIKTLVNNKSLVKGDHEVTWDGTNQYGTPVASGMYIYRLKAGNVVKSKKMTLIR